MSSIKEIKNSNKENNRKFKSYSYRDNYLNNNNTWILTIYNLNLTILKYLVKTLKSKIQATDFTNRLKSSIVERKNMYWGSTLKSKRKWVNQKLMIRLIRFWSNIKRGLAKITKALCNANVHKKKSIMVLLLLNSNPK